MNRIRNSAKAVIIDSGRLLLTRNRDHIGTYYLFPGGGQEFGEPLADTVVRECLEEIGRTVEVSDLLWETPIKGKGVRHSPCPFNRNDVLHCAC